jgi:hypothetical protein
MQGMLHRGRPSVFAGKVIFEQHTLSQSVLLSRVAGCPVPGLFSMAALLILLAALVDAVVFGMLTRV